jgi:hypothetical protein
MYVTAFMDAGDLIPQNFTAFHSICNASEKLCFSRGPWGSVNQQNSRRTTRWSPLLSASEMQVT